MSAKILVLDIERVPMWTRPLPVWDMKGLQNRRLTPEDIAEWGRTICLAYRWGISGPIHFAAEWQEGGREGFLRKTWELFNEADVLVGHNSKGFDYRHLQGEWNLLGLGPASPVQHFDTLLVARKNFNYEANHLDTLTKRFGISSKTDKYRIDVAMAAVNGDVAAQRKLERYNKGDVRASTGLYLWLRPWGDINLTVFWEGEDGTLRCPACEKTKVQRRGTATTRLGRYPRYHCQSCGKWGKGKRLEQGTIEVRS